MNQTSLHELGLMVAEGFNNLVVIEQSNEWLKEQDLTSEAERFELWAKNLGLFADGHASLDYRLRDATFVKDRFEELFRDLIEHLKELAMILKGERKPAEELDFPQDDSSSSGSSTKSSVLTRPAVSSGGDSFHEIDFRFQSLTDKINSLYRLATRIRNPKNRPSRTIDQLFEHIPEHDRLAHLRALERFETNIISYLLRQNIIEASSRESFRTDHAMSLEDILKQYAEPDCWIVRRAGKANARRKRQLAYWKEHALRLGQVKEKPIKSARPSPSESHITPGQHMSLSALGGQQKALPSLATSATKLPVIKPGDLKSVISHQSRVSTIMNVQQHDLNWPPPPAIPAQAQFFECLYCKVLCSKKYIEKGSWETHIIHDLKAYHCTYEQCQDPNRLYGSKQEWLNHESQHNLVWFCQDDEEEFETQPDYVHHFEAKHSEFRADRLPELLMSTAMTSSKQVHRSCPFCPTGFTDVVEMQKHIALHLVRLALLAIAPLDDDTTHNGESMQLPTTDQPQRLGRVRSIIGDFGIKHGEMPQNNRIN
ncbi:hypothetical protein F5Y14DRAFT_117188 [Nemania sp. NC0429]|nr:hypothetical protein F5Y14DRAFT_117188 [Nemania sp. NC0429]